MSDFRKLGNQLRGDMAIMEARMAEMGRKMGEFAGVCERAADSASRAAQAAAEAAQAAKEAAQAAKGAAQAAKDVGKESQAHFHWTEGRMRLMNQRFEKFLINIEDNVMNDLKDLKKRVRRLEEDRPPA